MWMHCHGAMAQPENQVAGGSSDFADDGTASHTLGAWALDNDKDCADYPELTIKVGHKEWDVDDERVEFVQSYVDEVRRRAMGGIKFIEHRVDLGDYLGVGPCWKCECVEPAIHTCEVCNGTGEAPQGGTSDTVIILPKDETLVAVDLKYGTGEKVYAGFFPHAGATKRKINTQCGNYLLGAKKDAELLGHKITKFIAVIDQPRLNHRDEFEITAEELETFADEVRFAIAQGSEAMTLGVDDPKLDAYLHPDEKTCRWCNAVVRCKARARHVAAAVKLEFDDEGVPTGTEEPQSVEHLAEAYKALPLVMQWVKAVNKALWESVPSGRVMGPDGKPLKIVAGKEGKRFWAKDKLEEVSGLMAGRIGEEAYKPRELITAPEFEKRLKKVTKLKGKAYNEMFNATYGDYIARAKGSLAIALGSDPRPAANVADASEFDDEISTDDEESQ
jgi:hypothetical protein